MKKYDRNPLGKLGIGAILAGMALAGCGDDAELTQLKQPPSTEPSSLGAFQYKTPVGVPVQASTDGKLITDLTARVQPTRRDPMALLPSEVKFDASQRGEFVLQNSGGHSTMFEPEAEIDESALDIIEPQPYRRLAGVLVADTVSAIIIMENGEAHLIRPGTMIPNSPWRVVSIDEEKAVLRRAGNRKPTQIIVRLESPPMGGGGGVGAPGGGAPGGGRGNAPGGRGGRGGFAGPDG